MVGHQLLRPKDVVHVQLSRIAARARTLCNFEHIPGDYSFYQVCRDEKETKAEFRLSGNVRRYGHELWITEFPSDFV